MRALMLLALAGAAVASPESKAISAVRSAFRPARRPAKVWAARKRALAGIEAFDGVKLGKALLSAAETLEAEVAVLEARRREYIGKPRHDRAMQMRADIDPLHALQGGVRDALLRLKEPGAVRLEVEAALHDGKLPLALRVELAARSGALDPAVKPALKGRDPAARVVALELVRTLGPVGAPVTDAVVFCLGAKERLVRERAAAALATMKVPRTIGPLIEQLALEKGQAKRRFAQALETLTRQKLGTVHRAWQRWWSDHKQSILAGRMKLGGGAASTPKDADRYHSIPMGGEAILFVVDVSQSMRKNMVNPSKVVRPGEETRIDRAKSELVRALGKLPPRKTFNIVTFARDSIVFSEETLPATKANIKRAQEWVKAIALQFGTAMYDGLELGFAVAGRPPRDACFDSTIDTLFLLSDGRPMVPSGAGGLVPDDRDAILSAVRRWNLLGQVTVHTIGLGQRLPKRLLRELAELHGGTFVHRKE